MNINVSSLLTVAVVSLSAHSVLATPSTARKNSDSIRTSQPAHKVQGRSSRIDRMKAENITYALYAGILQRNPDPEGLRNDIEYIMRGSSIPDAAFNIAESPEFREKILSTQTPRQIVEAMYQGLLGRAADEAGMQGWIRLVANNRSGEAASGIVASPEFRARFSIR